MRKMKINSLKIVAVVLIILVFSSCRKYKKEIERLELANSTIQTIADERTEVILEYVNSMNEIQQNLDSIKRIQKLVSLNFTDNNSEMKKTVKEQIIDDVNSLNDLLNKNKALLAEMQKKLNKSNYKTQELEQLLKSYTLRIEEKDLEISVLNAQISDLKLDKLNLNKQIDEMAVEGKLLANKIEEHKNELNTVYYCFGSEEELLSNNVVEKTGGFLGLGKSIKVKSDFNQDYFAKEDRRNLSEVILMAEKAILLTFHPDSSYSMVTNEKIIEKIVIADPTEFWKVSSYLVILVK